MSMLYKVRNCVTGEWTNGPANKPRFTKDGGRTWDNARDALGFVYRYNIGHRAFKENPTDPALEVVEFAIVERRVVPLPED